MKLNILNKTKIYLLVALLGLGITSCDKALDINTDPNNGSLEQGTPELVFPAAVASTAGSIGTEYAILGGIWSQYWTQSPVAAQYRTIDAYEINSSDFNNSFAEAFAGGLNDYNFVINKAKELNKPKFVLMGTVMKAYTYQMLLDIYDQLPYSEAFQGANNLQPKYEDGYTVYKGLLAEIDAALSGDITQGGVAVGDLVFGDRTRGWESNMDSWVAFANTLKLKFYLRMAYVQPAEAEAGIKALYSSGAKFLTIDASMKGFENAENKSNPLYEFNFRKLNINTNLRASKTFISWLQANGDPRIDFYFSKVGSNPFLGNNQGDYANPDPALANVSVAKIAANADAKFISSAESYFLQAEARERYFGGNGGKDAYESGVTAAFRDAGFESAAATLLAGNYKYKMGGTFEEKLEQIIVQKWASLPGNQALEGFIEKNRTGYPKTSIVYSTDLNYIPGQFVVSKTSKIGNALPKRIVLPDSERKTNTNTPPIVPITNKIWWDKK